MSLRRLLPTLDNAGRRLVLAEVLGQPVSMRRARRRGKSVTPERSERPSSHTTALTPEASELPKISPIIESPSTQEVTEETAVVDMRSLIAASEATQAPQDTQEVSVTGEGVNDD